MTIKRKMKWKYTHHTIDGKRRKVKIHRKRVLDGYLVRVVKKHHTKHHKTHHRKHSSGLWHGIKKKYIQH